MPVLHNAYRQSLRLVVEEAICGECRANVHDEAVVRHCVGKLSLEQASDTVRVILLEIAVCAEVIAHKDCHNLAFGQFALAVSVTFAFAAMRRKAHVFCKIFIKFIVKLVDNTENFRKSNVSSSNSRYLELPSITIPFL